MLRSIPKADSGHFNSAEGIADLPRLRIADVPVAILDRTAAARITVDGARAAKAASGPPMIVTTLNGQSVSLIHTDRDVRHAFDQAEVILADGMSIVTASRKLSPEPLPERLATTDIFHDTADCAAEEGATFFFLGATEEVCRKAVQNARKRHPDLRIVGWRDGYFDASKLNDVLAEIDMAAPDVLWVGMGVQRQMCFAASAKGQLRNVGCIRTCGGLFDFLAGRVARAPDWIQTIGFEWLFRTFKEPRRLGWRYLTTTPHAIFLLLTRTGGYSQSPASFDEASIPRETAAATLVERSARCAWAPPPAGADSSAASPPHVASRW